MSLVASLVAIFPHGKSAGPPVGTGIVVSETEVLTCAHVVNEALRRRQADKERPSSEARVSGRVDQNHLELRLAPGSSEVWSPPRVSQSDGLDLCLLQVVDGPTLSPVRWIALRSPERRDFVAAGYPSDWEGDVDVALGVTLLQVDDLVMLRAYPDVQAVQQAEVRATWISSRPRRVAGVIHSGFSGGPVVISGKVAGMIVEARDQVADTTAYMIPTNRFPAALRDKLDLVPNEIVERHPHVRVLLDSLDEVTRGKGLDPQRPFDIRARLVESFDEVLEVCRQPRKQEEGGNQRPSDPLSDLTPSGLARALAEGTHSGRQLAAVHLQAPGGAGKSSFVLNLLRAAPDEGLVPFFLDFSFAEEGGLGQDVGNRAASEVLADWFRLHGGYGTSEKLLELADRGAKPLLVIDGFNEAKRNWKQVLTRLGMMMRAELSGAALVVADRVVERGAPSVFCSSAILPLSRQAYEEQLGALARQAWIRDAQWLPLLSSPLFLDMIVSTSRAGSGLDRLDTYWSPTSGPSRGWVLGQYFEGVCGFDSRELEALATLAFDLYERVRQTSILKPDWTRSFGESVARVASKYAVARDELEQTLKSKIQAAGLVHDSGRTVEFRHHLLHDYLAARYAVTAPPEYEEDVLRSTGFDVLSLDAASYESLELAVDLIRVGVSGLTPGLTASRFLSEVYDWNYWHALEVVSSLDRRNESSLFEPWIRHAVYILNLEKQFDVFLHTSARAADLRREIDRSVALPYGSVASLEELRGAVGELEEEGLGEDPEAWEVWSRLYLTSGQLSEAQMKAFWSDPISAWTAANVVRRVGADRSTSDRLLELYDVSRQTSDSSARAASFRWRIVHALGGGPLEASSKLCEILRDPQESHWVKYGSVRSLVELAARGDSDTARRILGDIGDAMGELFPGRSLDDARSAGMAHVRLELRRACAIDERQVGRDAGWDAWLSGGLSEYKSLLEQGEGMARSCGLETEADRWRTWVDAASEVIQNPSDWNARRGRWILAIGQDGP